MRIMVAMEIAMEMLLTQHATMASTEGEAGVHGGVSDSIVTEFSTYEDFLDSQITPTDLYYLEVNVSPAVKGGRLILINVHRVRMRNSLAS